jgi:predicted AlkP superfamily pyrophosphatase or phosphodiesterase
MQWWSRALIVCSALMAGCVFAGHADDLPRVVLISIDGLQPSRYTSTGPARIPNLRRVMRQGVHADAVEGVFPSVTYPSHTTLITGVPPGVHGIIDNRIVDPERRANGGWFWYARWIRVPTLATAARAQGLRAAAVSWPVSVGLDIDYLVPEFSRSNHPESLVLLRALSRPRDVIDDAEKERGRPLEWPATDADRTALASYVLRRYRPHLMLLHLIELDSAQHETGPSSDESLAALERLDGHVGEILLTLERAGLRDHTNVVIASDHGFLELRHQLQPNAAFRNEGLITVDGRGTVTSWQAWFHSSGGAGFVYLKDPADDAVRERVHQVLRTIQSDPANGLRRIWTREELDRLGAHPDAAFGLDVVDGFYTSTAHDVLVAPSTTRGGHGYDPARAAMDASFIMAGPAVGRRGSLGGIRMTQIAPTLAEILGVTLSSQADRPLTIAD